MLTQGDYKGLSIGGGLNDEVNFRLNSSVMENKYIKDMFKDTFNIKNKDIAVVNYNHLYGGDGDPESSSNNPPQPADNGTNPPPPADNGTNPPPPADNGTNPPPPTDNGTNPPPPADNGTNPPPPADNGTNPPPPSDNGTNPPPPAPSNDGQPSTVQEVIESASEPGTQAFTDVPEVPVNQEGSTLIDNDGNKY